MAPVAVTLDTLGILITAAATIATAIAGWRGLPYLRRMVLAAEIANDLPAPDFLVRHRWRPDGGDWRGVEIEIVNPSRLTLSLDSLRPAGLWPRARLLDFAQLATEHDGAGNYAPPARLPSDAARRGALLPLTVRPASSVSLRLVLVGADAPLRVIAVFRMSSRRATETVTCMM